LQAAVSGLGVAIGQRRLLDAEFAAGQLVRPFARTKWKPFTRDRAYWLLRPQHQRETRKTRAFREWLLETVKQLPPLKE
jgi:LysR family transcriptional regulator, glycine cleavage system transcriptional activator